MIYGDTTEYQLGYVEKNLPISELTDLVIGVGTYVKATHQSMQEQLFMSYDVAVEGVSVFTLRYISICGYDSLYRKVFSKAATPTDEKDEILIPACKEMIVDRLDNIVCVTEDKSDAEKISTVADKVRALETSGITFEVYKKQLSSIYDEFNSTAGETAQEKAASAILAYVISL